MPLQRRKTEKRNYRVVLLGSTGVGKTAIVSQLVHTNFPEKHKETLEELHHLVLIIDSMEVEIDILDTSGTHEFPAMRHLAITTGNAFLLVYSVDKRESFSNVRFLINEIREYKQDKDYFILVIANKTDLLENKKQCQAIEESVVCLDWEEKFLFMSAKNSYDIEHVLDILKEKVKEKIISEGNKQPHLRRISLPTMKITKHGHSKIPKLEQKTRAFSAD